MYWTPTTALVWILGVAVVALLAMRFVWKYFR